MNRISKLTVMMILSLVFAANAGAAGKRPSSFYVAANGSDSAPGNMAKPFLTLQHAEDQVKPGDTINVRGGKYCERLSVHDSGNAAQGYIVFRSQPGEMAILDGSCLTPKLGDSSMIELRDVSYVRIQGLEVRNYKTADRMRAPAGIRVYGSGSHIEILNNNVHNIEQTYPGRMGPGHGANGFGIAVYGTRMTPISDLLVQGNEVHNLQTGSSESLVLNGNVTHFRVTGNRVHDNNNIGIDIIGFERTAPDPKVDRARDGIVNNNLVYSITSRGNPAYGNDVSSDGIYVDGGTRVLIFGNVIHNVDFGIELASEHSQRDTSYIVARDNLIYRCHTAGISIGGYDAKRGSTHDSAIVNNTLYKNDTQNTGTGEFQMQYYLRNNIFENNIIYVGDSKRALNSKTGPMNPGTPTVTLDHNVYYYPGGPGAVRWSYDGKDYGSFKDYVKATGNDRHSVFADPKFVDPAKDNFHLQSNSPARGVGVNLGPSVTGQKDLDGESRVTNGKIDAGCYETK